jgi:hypothetical protein
MVTLTNYPPLAFHLLSIRPFSPELRTAVSGIEFPITRRNLSRSGLQMEPEKSAYAIVIALGRRSAGGRDPPRAHRGSARTSAGAGSPCELACGLRNIIQAADSNRNRHFSCVAAY